MSEELLCLVCGKTDKHTITPEQHKGYILVKVKHEDGKICQCRLEDGE